MQIAKRTVHYFCQGISFLHVGVCVVAFIIAANYTRVESGQGFEIRSLSIFGSCSWPPSPPQHRTMESKRGYTHTHKVDDGGMKRLKEEKNKNNNGGGAESVGGGENMGNWGRARRRSYLISPHSQNNQ